MAEEEAFENLDSLDWSDVESELKANRDQILSEVKAESRGQKEKKEGNVLITLVVIVFSILLLDLIIRTPTVTTIIIIHPKETTQDTEKETIIITIKNILSYLIKKHVYTSKKILLRKELC